MFEKYNNWIQANVGDNNGYGLCHGICEKMKEEFPELELRKGHFFSTFWGKRPHWWLRDPNKKIVDPTSLQHPDGLYFPPDDCKYEDMTDLSDKELMEIVPTGRCADCGEDVYKNDSFCSKSCQDATERYLNSI